MFSPSRLNFRVVAAATAVLVLSLGLRGALAAKEPAAPESASKTAPDRPAAVKAAGEGDAAESGPAAYPVVTTRPVKRSVPIVVRGIGTVRPDARSARSITSATVVVIGQVLVLPGERVRRGQPLIRVEPDPLAYLAYQQASSAAILARNEVGRLTVQRADGLATASQLESAQKALADANAAVDAARRQGATSSASVIAAPIDGIVTTISAVAGDRPAVGTVLATVSPLPDRVALGIEPGLQARVHIGDHVTVHAVQGDDAPRSGRVAQVGAALDAETRLVLVSVVLEPGKEGPYLAGLAVEGAIDTRAIDAFSLPRTALVKDDDGVNVFEVRDGKAHRVRVAVASDDGPRVAVTGELDSSRPVVTTGAYELEDGVAVEEQRP